MNSKPPVALPADSKPPTSGLAIASLVFGLLPCGVTGVAGIICGIMAKSRIAKSAGRLGGDTLATIGIILSAVVSLAAVPMVAIMAGMLLPALAKAKGKAQRISCVNNLKSIGLACRMYAVDHDGKYPAGFGQIASELALPQLLICPADASHQPAFNWGQFTTNNCSYSYFGAGLTNEAFQVVISSCTHHFGANVLLGDGSVQQLSLKDYDVLVRLEGGRMIYRGR